MPSCFAGALDWIHAILFCWSTRLDTCHLVLIEHSTGYCAILFCPSTRLELAVRSRNKHELQTDVNQFIEIPNKSPHEPERFNLTKIYSNDNGRQLCKILVKETIVFIASYAHFWRICSRHSSSQAPITDSSIIAY